MRDPHEFLIPLCLKVTMKLVHILRITAHHWEKLKKLVDLMGKVSLWGDVY